MYRPTSHPRGMALVMAMVVVVLMTLLVAGAIAFTGTERAAAEIQVQEDTMSSCVQAARNLFVSKIVMLDKDSPAKIVIDEDLRGIKLRTGHLGGVAAVSAVNVSATMKDPNTSVNDCGNKDCESFQPEFYTVTAVCRDGDAPDSPEREIEFMVRVGI